MKVRITIEVTDSLRRALNARLGKPGKATRMDVSSSSAKRC